MIVVLHQLRNFSAISWRFWTDMTNILTNKHYLVLHVWTMQHTLHLKDNFAAASNEQQFVRSGHWLPTATSFTTLYCGCLSQARTWISKAICHDIFFLVFNGLWWDEAVCFNDIGGIVDYHCLNFFHDIVGIVICRINMLKLI